MIMNISAERIKPHPHNPRKDLGDLTELADSIKVHGILQNLTVVPIDLELYQKKIASKKAYTGDYWAVIGHRRNAAATIAGLPNRPCVVSDMNAKEQIAVMLIENLQRSDLSYLEQAEGFQMMLDMGDSVADIAEQTGFGKETIHKRIKLLKNDHDKLEEALGRGGTLEHFAALDKIKCRELKKRVLDAIGTPNFNHALKKALDHEKSEAKGDALRLELQTFATEIQAEDSKDKKHVQFISTYGKVEFQKPEDTETCEYFFLVREHGIALYRRLTEQDKAQEEQAVQARQQIDERSAALSRISEHGFELRMEFIKNLSGLKKNREKLPTIVQLAVESMLSYGYHYRFNCEIFCKVADIELDDDNGFNTELISDLTSEQPERALLVAAYSNLGDTPQQRYHNYQGKYVENELLDMVYGYLEQLGYEASDEEVAYREGTHELFQDQPSTIEQAA